MLRFFGRLLSFALFGLAIVFLVRAVGDGWRSVGERLRDARPGYLAMAVLANLSCHVVWATRWRLMLRPVARVSWWPAQKALMASVFINTVVPFARSLGGLVRATHLGRSRGLAVAPLYGATLIDQLGYTVASLALGAFFVPLAAWGDSAGRGRIVLAVVVTAIVLGASAGLLRGRGAPAAAWVRRRMPGAKEAVDSGVAAAREVLSRRATWVIAPVGGVAVWFCNVLTFVLAGRAVGADVSLGAAAAAWSIGSIVGVASGTPGGIGTTESAAIVPLIAQGIPAPAAFAAVLLARLIQYAGAITIGGACFLSGPRRSEPESPPADEPQAQPPG